MPIFTLTLQRTYYDKGFFKVTVDYDRYVRPDEGTVTLELGPHGQIIEGRIDHQSNQNETARIFGGNALRDWFQAVRRQAEMPAHQPSAQLTALTGARADDRMAPIGGRPAPAMAR